MLNCFHLIPERYGQTDGWTDRRTDRIATSVSRISVLTRDKKTNQKHETPRPFDYNVEGTVSICNAFRCCGLVHVPV